MNNSARLRGQYRRPWPATARLAAVVLALAMLAACSGSPSSGGSGSPGAAGPGKSPSANSQVLAFSRCVRMHGVPGYPDPDTGGQVAKETAQQLGVSNAQLQTALSACEHLLPKTGNIDNNPVALHRWWSQMQRFAECMHARGVANWPGPTPYPQDPAEPTFKLHAAGIAFHRGSQPGNIVNAPQIEAAVQRCDAALHQNFSGYFD